MNSDEPQHKTCNRLLKQAEGGFTEIVVSALTLAETVRPKGVPKPLGDEHRDKIEAFFENDYILMRAIDRNLAIAAQRLCWNAEWNLKPRDAIHLAAAMDMECDVLETIDPDLLKLNGQLAIRIDEPRWYGQTTIEEALHKEGGLHDPEDNPDTPP